MKPLTTLCLSAMLMLTVAATAEESSPMKLTDLPDAVQKAFKAAHPDLEVTGCDREMEGEVAHFEVETRTGETEKDYVFLEDGTLLQTEEPIAVDSLPEVVTQAIMKAHPKCELDEAEKITLGSALQYEVVVEDGEAEYELLLASDGKILTSVKVANDTDEDSGDADEADQEDED